MSVMQCIKHKKNIFIYLISCFIITSGKLFAQSLVTIPNTVEWSFVSKVNQKNYNLHIAMPHGYGKSDDVYPTIYVLDANNDFPLVTSIARRLQAEEELKDFIVVGISYPDSVWYSRGRDYTPSKGGNWEHAGGGADFKKIIETEIIPLVEKKCRANGSRTLLGHSLGGLFGAYLLVNGVPLFTSYIVSSPSMWWDDYYVFKSKNSSFSPATIFMSVGELESPHMIESCNKLSAFVDENLKSSSKKMVVLDGETHASAKIRAYSAGLRWLFKLD